VSDSKKREKQFINKPTQLLLFGMVVSLFQPNAEKVNSNNKKMIS